MALLIPRRTVRLAARCAVAMAFVALYAERGYAQAAPGPLEYRVKAAYLLNFARYVQWPPSAFADPDSPINVCVLGRDPFGRVLEETFEGRHVNTRPFRVLRPVRPAAELCHVAFVGESTAAVREAWLGVLRDEATLTVGEGSDFARQGGMIGFVPIEETVRFEINVEAVEAGGLQISSRVLALATRIYPERGNR
ncbi:MAG TPA: YfiR family protein [Gemmatimonadales bacterium]|nr:YfiR family protein [Gemmatimonadales bacterium]